MQSLKPEELKQNPYERSNVFSRLCFWYTLPTFFKGRKVTFESKDLFQALHEHKSELLGNKLCNAWERELQLMESNKRKPSLLRATVAVFSWPLAMLGLILFLLELGVRCLQPLFLLGLISYYASYTDSIQMAYLYAFGLIISSALSVAIIHPYMLGTMHIGMKMRIAMCSMIYRKTLRLSKTALGNTTAGQVVNLLSNDVGRLDLAIIFLHYLWVGPLQTLLITYLMYREIGVSAVFGVAFMLLFLPLQGWLGKKTSVLRLRTAMRTDERVRLMNEIISGIQVIKMYTWEIPFGNLVAETRKKEINCIKHVSYIRGILLSFIMFLTRVSIFLSLVIYVLLSNFLTPEKAFVITAYYNILRTTMTVFFPQGISQLAEALVSIKRIQNYMEHPETSIPDQLKETAKENFEHATDQLDITKSYETSNSLSNTNAVLSEAGIIVNNVKAKWDPSCSDYTLYDINLRVQPGTLVAIIGPVGAGKSSLIQNILGELKQESGTIKINGTVSYAPQESWLFTGTVRQNILFGQPMDRKRYNSVIKKCALERDFELLPFSDKTIVGERGASLSGGQKARISLARAVYRKASIYLLDDPLSAVDTHVGRHLFDQCMRGFLKDNIVLLVTHQLQFLQAADQIVIMDKGVITAVGTYESLQESGLDFAQLLATQGKDEKDNATLTRSRSGSYLSKRHNSESSLNSAADSVLEDMPLPAQETKEEGNIGFHIYKIYFGAGGGCAMFTTMSFFCILSHVLASGGDYFLSYWVNMKGTYGNDVNGVTERKLNGTLIDDVTIMQKLTNFILKYNIDIGPETLDIYIFTAITLGTIVVTLLRSFLFFNVAMRASINLHNSMFHAITRGVMHFFHTNPSGRILNRFSKDMGQIDEILPVVMIDVIQIFLSLFGIVIVIAIVNPLFLIPTVLLAIIFYYLRIFYLKTSRNIKRLEAITRSPIYTHLAASLSGLSTIRAFGAQKILINEFDGYQDLHSSAFFLFICTSRAFGYWLDCFCVLFIAIVILSFFIFDPVNGGAVGLAITQAMGMTGMVQWGMRQSAELENTMTAVERVVEYKDIEPEGDLLTKEDKKPPKNWPEEGKIVFDNLSLRYFPDPKSEYVLKSLSFEIKGSEKVGIVGRTGAGKSSLINALYRLSYTEGGLLIDNRNIKDIGLHDLRSKISIIPQEPVLFSGTMRYNLDPFDEYSDAKLWKALEEVKLKVIVSELPSGLHSKISEGGANFSVGQRQLVCLARAILRENRILVMDEATANVDPQTDALIQITIRSKFANCTVLTIAHRLHTVMDSDKVLVMDAGQVVEFGAPYELLTQSEKMVFHEMVKSTGKSTYDSLLKIAKKAYEESKQANVPSNVTTT